MIIGEGSSFLDFIKGDLILLDQQNGETVRNFDWNIGECVRTKKKGYFPAECVYILPTITKPPQDILVRSQTRGNHGRKYKSPNRMDSLLTFC